ncbi:MAG: CehA/McbA family metallohydrolase [Acidobacteria bacterium]|nr:CehA/McbA family metallohydrolase [Acidobacteriota bacterium]
MRTHLPALVAAAALFTIVAMREGVIHSAARDTTSWGANDPAWSPDGKRLAFTLFGSVWSVDREGGEARQLTSSAGYHAHPAWSPKGDWIAFIKGNVPAGPLPNIAGRLAIVNPATGEERELRTQFPTAGTPAWSPDGTKIAVGLLTPEAGGLLHTVDVRNGSVEALQTRTQRGVSGNWMPAAWSPKGHEIFYAGVRFNAVNNGSQKLGSPQVWSVPAVVKPIQVALPLTSYRLTDIAQLHSLSALPDGSGVVYSAVVVNGKGDRELYRVPAGGGKPAAITNTPRDEFAPAVSPDGKTIAHVSNHLGNLDLFLMPVTGGEKKHVRIAGLQFRARMARLQVKTLDEQGKPTPVRLYLRASDGKHYGPKGAQIFYYGLDPGSPREGFFVSSGEDEIVLPAGRVRLVALKGIEYSPEELTLDLAANESTATAISMKRWTNWNQKGWYSGENHFHANYNGSYYQRPPDSLDWLQAEDLNTANMIVANSEGAFVHDKEFFTGDVAPLSKPRFVLFWGQEYRNSDPLGHMAFLNIKKQVPPSFTSVVGSNSPYDYPLNTMAAMEARKQGGLVVYVHPLSGPLRDAMDSNLGAKEAPLTAALGAMDAIDILPYGPAAYELWYRLLNCGFRISPGGGTDVFTNWRGINNTPGGARQYVDVGGEFRWNKWVERYREGRAFVTNGPLVMFTANGQGPGSVLRENRVRLAAEVSSRVPVESLEIVQNGVVIATGSGPRLEKEVTVEKSAWFAVRVSGKPVRGLGTQPSRAHSGAVYVHVNGKPVVIKEDVELMIRWLGRLWGYLEERNNFGPGTNRENARKMFEQALTHYREKLRGL